MRAIGKYRLIGTSLLSILAMATPAMAGDKAAKSPRSMMTNAEVIAARQSAFLLSAANFGSMKGAIDRGDEVKTLGFLAMAQTRWAMTLPSLFPKGTLAANSEALPIIWSDRAGFELKAKDYAIATEKLLSRARANDKAGFATQWAAVRQTCSACHDIYKKPSAPPVPPAPPKS